MSFSFKKVGFLIAILTCCECSLAIDAQVKSDALGVPVELITPEQPSPSLRAALLESARTFYEFWTTGDEKTLKRVISPSFRDHDLPYGRPQGPDGPLFAIRQFKTAVPDLRCAVLLQIIAGDRVISHLRFTGHFTGSLAGAKGSGEEIDFVATDILRIQDGLITDNWHIEDNLAFMRQAGLLSK